MGSGHRSYYAKFFVVFDLVIVVGSWLLAYQVRFRSGVLPIYYGTPEMGVYIAALPLVVSMWGIVFVHMGVYTTTTWPLTLYRELVRLFQASCVATGGMIGAIYLAMKVEISRMFYLCFCAMCVSLLCLSRVAARALFQKIERNARRRRVLLVGSGPMSERYLEKVRRRPDLCVDVRGRLTDCDSSCVEPTVPVLGSTDRIREVVERERIDLVVFALGVDSYASLQRMLKAIEDLTVDVQIILDVFHIIPLCPGIEDLEGIPIVRLRQSPQQGLEGVAKRLMDICIGSVALVLMLPIVALSALAVLVCSGRPVLYAQRRMGLDGKEFRMFKIRTMRVDAETGSEPGWSRSNDPRRTKIGALLRRYSLDELPQLFNVIKGEMSLVGPRPERPELISIFRQKIPGYMLRYKVKAGMTGWAQVHGLRGDTSLEKRIQYDIQYMQCWSLGLDAGLSDWM